MPTLSTPVALRALAQPLHAVSSDPKLRSSILHPAKALDSLARTLRSRASRSTATPSTTERATASSFS